jgi:hypothetical protein
MSNDVTLIGLMESIATHLPPAVDLPREEHSDWREEVIVAYCSGKGEFSQDTQFINLQLDMFDLHSRWIGYQQGVHQSESTPADLLYVPPMPEGPMDQPVGPVPHLPIKEWTKGVWTFADGSQIYAAGVAMSHLVPLNDGSFLFMVTTDQTVTGGTGRYKGVYGTKQATGTAFVPREIVGHFPAQGMIFDAHTIETFRAVKHHDLKVQPAVHASAGGAEPKEGKQQ